MRVKTKATLVTLVSFFLLLGDRVLKFLVQRAEGRTLIDGVLEFRLFENHELAFSLPISWGATLSLLALLIIAFVLIKAYRLSKEFYYYEASLWLMIFFGASSNMYDRLMYGFVVDYVHIPPMSFFNIADVLIGVGVILLFFIKPKLCRSSTSS